jgi:methionyl-tRNA formyltransferase
MRVFILTVTPSGYPAVALKRLLETPGVEVGGVVLARGVVKRPLRQLRRKLAKTLRIGPLGAWNGLRMRSWFDDADPAFPPVGTLAELCSEHGVPLLDMATTAAPSPAELEAVAGLRCELGLSLGNGWIATKLRRLPPRGMLNVHHELLPERRGAAPVVWAIHEGSTLSGFTIHRVARRIDAGEILWREEMELELGDTLEDTVRRECVRIKLASIERLAQLVADLDAHLPLPVDESAGRTYTTPTWREYRRMNEQFDRLRDAAR